jgi:TolB-like protein/Flp pilus assembly protein TadD
MSNQLNELYQFGPFRIDPAERLLRRGTEVIPLTPKAMETLLVLVTSGGRAVDKEELMRRVWPDTFVEEGGLARNISLLRKALGDSAEDTQDNCYIETIPRRGYRFVVPVSTVRASHDAARSLAVLPLANLSHDPVQEFFADGMTDELISYLMHIEALRVTSRTSAMAYKGLKKSLREIARELEVTWVVEGTVLQAAGRVRITARLIEGANENHLWSGTYEKDIRDVLSIQSEVASDIAREIRVKVTSPEKARLAQSRLVDPEAYQDYLRGRYFWNKRTTDSLNRARDYFRQAIDKDPSYAPAHSGLADAYAVLGSTGYDVMPPKDAMPRAKAAAMNALQIDERLAEAHAALGYVHLVYEWDWNTAERELTRAIELNPSYATAHQWRGELFMALSRPEHATASFKRALELDPLSIPCNLGLGWSYYFSRNYDRAIEQYRRTVEIAPNVPMALYGLGLSYHHAGQPALGLAEIRNAYESTRGEAAAVMLMGVARAMAGDRTGAGTGTGQARDAIGRKIRSGGSFRLCPHRIERNRSSLRVAAKGVRGAIELSYFPKRTACGHKPALRRTIQLAAETHRSREPCVDNFRSIRWLSPRPKANSQDTGRVLRRPHIQADEVGGLLLKRRIVGDHIRPSML